MIEVPRAALTADEIAEHADFFSFGTNDLTQTTFAISRDDAEAGFLVQYVSGDPPGQPVRDPGRGRAWVGSWSWPWSWAGGHGPGSRSGSAASTGAIPGRSPSATASGSTT
jgi:hypothetical protein